MRADSEEERKNKRPAEKKEIWSECECEREENWREMKSIMNGSITGT